MKSGGESSPVVRTIQIPPPRCSNALHPHPSNIARSNAYKGYNCGSMEMGTEMYRPGAPFVRQASIQELAQRILARRKIKILPQKVFGVTRISLHS